MKKYLMTLAGLLVAMTLTAAPVTRDAARQKALQFLSERGSGVAAARGMQPVDMQLSDAADMEQLYVFNVGRQEGFVIVSGDDCTGDLVLGYADSGEISPATMPDNLRAWLQGYADQIRWMQKNGVKNEVAAARALTESAARKPVSPVLTTLWNQDEPYNDNCPLYAKNAGGSSYYQLATATGCVATAAAQVMYYQALKHKISSTTTSLAIPAYATSNLFWNKAKNAVGNFVEEKPVATIDWSAITADGGTAPASDEAKAAVATLMEYVGASIEMQYGTPEDHGGSLGNASKLPEALKKYFGYDNNVRFLRRNNYVYADWLDLIYQELTTNGPVIYGGSSTGGGHEFVLDGYKDEDYFYVNWGWGGLSNGYFKLSVARSDKQGIGGSTSQDGYSFDQEAIIGMNPVNSSADTSIRLTTRAAWAGAASYNRASTSANFSAVDLHCTVWNWTGAVNDFDYGFGLYQNGELKQVLWQRNITGLGMNSGWNNVYQNASFGADLDDGVYKLLPISRQKDTSTWYPDFESETYYILATISGTTLTLERMGVVNLTATSFVVSDSPTAGLPVTVTATVENNGSLYSGDLTIAYISDYYDGDPIYKKLAAQQIEMTAGKTSTFEFTFTPSIIGTITLCLLDKNDKALSSQAVSIADASLGTNTLTQISSTITNGEYVGYPWVGEYAVYGNTLKGTVTIRNNSASTNTSGIRLAVAVVNGDWVDGLEKNIEAVLPGNSETVVDFEIGGFESGVHYNVYFCYPQGGNILNTSDQVSRTNPFYTIPGVVIYDAAGVTNIIKMEDAIVINDNTVAAVDITGCGTKAVTPNTNPNTLYIMGSTDNPSGLTGKNVVKGGTAESLNLTDGYSFYSPIEFNTTTATYTRTFTNGADGSNGWNTIILPFTVSTVKQNENIIDWFHSSSDTGKNFWLKEFVSESDGVVNFGFADQLLANTPYIIAVPGDYWGVKWDLTNQPIQFIGHDVVIESSWQGAVSGNNYKFQGTLKDESVSDCYLMNAAGNSFVLGSGSVPAFRAWFQPIKMLAGARLAIGTDDGTTGIDSRLNGQQPTADGIYNLGGQRVTQPGKGLYIIGGKKVIVK